MALESAGTWISLHSSHKGTKKEVDETLWKTIFIESVTSKQKYAY